MSDFEDDLLNYDLPDSLPQIDFDAPTAPTRSSPPPKKDTLGVDDEVEIKKRVPKPKLDATLLLSARGIPLLQKEAPVKLGKRLRREKGKEYADARRILEFYQIWADGMFPKARFRDVLGLVEKEGRGRRLKIARREWVDEARGHKKAPAEEGEEKKEEGEDEGEKKEERKKMVKAKGGKLFFTDDEDEELFERPEETARKAAAQKKQTDLFFSDDDEPPSTRPKPAAQDYDSDMDDLDALLAAEASSSRAPASSAAPTKKPPAPAPDEDFDMDELDAMMEAESAASKPTAPPKRPSPRRVLDDDDEDELEAMIAAEEATRNKGTQQPKPPAKTVVVLDDEFGDDLDGDVLDALMEVEKEASKKMEEKKEEEKVVERKPTLKELGVHEEDDDDMEFDFSQ